MKKKFSGIVYAVIVFVLVGAIIWLIADFCHDKKAGSAPIDISKLEENAQDNKLFDSKKLSLVKETVTIDTAVISEKLNDIGKLITEEYFLTMVEQYEKKETVGFLVSTAKITYSYDCSVTAGFDCENIIVSKNDETKTITITLPKASIQTVDIDFDSFKSYEEKQGLWSKIRLMDVNKSLAEFEESAKAKATEKGILEKADKNAESVLDRMLSALVTDDYTIKYIHK